MSCASAKELAVAPADAGAQTQAPLKVKVYNADIRSFHVNAVVVSGKSEAIVIDCGKTLETIIISNANPDFYFGVEVLKRHFPQARVLATPAVREKIQSKLPQKIAFGGPKMGANAPTQPIVPDALDGTTLSVDGETIEVRGTTGEIAHRPYAWIPSIKTVAGNIALFGQPASLDRRHAEGRRAQGLVRPAGRDRSTEAHDRRAGPHGRRHPPWI